MNRPDDRDHGNRLDRTLTWRLHALHKLTDVISSRAYVAETGLSMSVGRCLTAIGTFAPLSVNDLADQANLNKGQASRAAQALVDAGLVKKITNRADARGVVLTLTPRGKTTWRRAMDLVARRNDEIFGSFSAAERTQFSAMLDRLLDQARLQAGGDAAGAETDE